METIIGSTWYSCADAARALEIEESVMQRFFDRMIAEGKVPISICTGPETPRLSGYTLRQFVRPQQQEQPKLPVRKRRHAR